MMEELSSSQEMKKEVKPKNRLALFSVFISLIVLITTLVLFKEVKNDMHRFQVNQVQLAKSGIQVDQTFHIFQDKINDQENKLDALNETLQRLAQFVGPVENGLLVQAEYLVQLSQFSLTYQRDVLGALALLKLADQRLASLSLSPILEVRQILAKNILALQSISVIDLAGIMTKLNVLSDQVEQLPLVPSLPRSEMIVKQPNKPTKLDTYLSDWKSVLSTSWHALERVIVIRHHGQPIEPLLAPEEYLYLKQNIELQLEIAQWAAIHQQQTIYIESLRKAAGWVNRYFTDNGLLSRAVQHDIAELQKYVIAPSLPDLTASINAITQAQKRIFEMTANKQETISVPVPTMPVKNVTKEAENTGKNKNIVPPKGSV